MGPDRHRREEEALDNVSFMKLALSLDGCVVSDDLPQVRRWNQA
jgi:hypothetical protein